MKRPAYIKDEHLEYIDTFKGKKGSRLQVEYWLMQEFQYLKGKEAKVIVDYWLFDRCNVLPD